MQWPYGTPGAENVHAAWRMRLAERAAGVSAGNRTLAALAVAGSVGAGVADRFSDLELDCYWVRPPADADRLAPVRALDGELTALWDYDQDDEEWSEDYLVGELGITVSNFSSAPSSSSSMTCSSGQIPTPSGTCAWPRCSAAARLPARR